MIYMYCPRKSGSARDLADVIGAVRLRKFDGATFWRKGKPLSVKDGDHIICWGNPIPGLDDDPNVLNSADIGNKRESAAKLTQAGIPTISMLGQDREFTPSDMKRHSLKALESLGGVPFPKGSFSALGGEVYIPRSLYHVGGEDLLKPGKAINFYVKYEKLTEEFRIHSFRGKSIRAGVKVHREGFCLRREQGLTCEKCKFVGRAGEDNVPHGHHPWVRSFDGGWKIQYDNFKSSSSLRKLAHVAVKTLGLDFGAVDIGKTVAGKHFILEVNRAPGIEGGSLDQYRRAVEKWVKNPSQVEKEDE